MLRLASVLTRLARCRIINRFSLPRALALHTEAFCPLVYHALISRCPSESASLSSLVSFSHPQLFSRSSSPGHSFPVLSTLSDARFPGFELGLSFLIVPRSLPTLPPLTRSFPRAFPICLSFPLVSPFSLLLYPFSSVDLSSARDFTSHGWARAIRASGIARDMIHFVCHIFFNTPPYSRRLICRRRLIDCSVNGEFSFSTGKDWVNELCSARQQENVKVDLHHLIDAF